MQVKECLYLQAKRLIMNPFITTGKIPAELFCDRKEESKRLLQSLTNGANVVLMAPRRVGKTQLMYYCFDKHTVSDNYITFFLDILKTSTLQEFTYELGKAVFNTLASRGQKMQKLAIATMRSLTGNIGFDPVTALSCNGPSYLWYSYRRHSESHLLFRGDFPNLRKRR